MQGAILLAAAVLALCRPRALPKPQVPAVPQVPGAAAAGMLPAPAKPGVKQFPHRLAGAERARLPPGRQPPCWCCSLCVSAGIRRRAAGNPR